MRERAIEFGNEVNRVVIVLIAEAATARTAADLVARGIDMHLGAIVRHLAAAGVDQHLWRAAGGQVEARHAGALGRGQRDRTSTRLNSSHSCACRTPSSA